MHTLRKYYSVQSFGALASLKRRNTVVVTCLFRTYSFKSTTQLCFSKKQNGKEDQDIFQDFVDVDQLAGFSFTGSENAKTFNGNGSADSENDTCRHSYHQSESKNQENEEEEILGVVREAEVPEGTEFSRMNIPLNTPRQGKPLPRENTRAFGAEYDSADPAQYSRIESNDSGKEGTSGSAPTDAAEAEEDDDMVLAPLPGVENELPYDDEHFAEMLLQMEVEGAIDEAWQDSRRAHLEDVEELTEVLKEMRVRDICCIDVSSKTSNFDYMMFGTCEGPRHIHLAAWAAQEADALKRVSKVPRRKTDEQWEVVPIGRIVLNLMMEGIREELSLERKWAVTKHMDPLAAANAPVSEGRQVRAHGLWTLTLNLQDLEDFEVDYCKDILMRQV